MNTYCTEKSENIFLKICNNVPNGVNYNFFNQGNGKIIYYSYGKKSRLWDVDGNEYLDLYCKSGSMILGHSNDEYNSKLIEQMNSVVSVNDHENMIGASRLIKKCFPSCEMMRFGLSGTETVQNALRLARAYTGKEKIVRFVGHFHGNADNMLGDEFDKFSFQHIDTYKSNLSTYGRTKDSMSQSYILPWNDINAFELFIRSHHQTIAAVIMEPIMINNVGVIANREYLLKVKKICSYYNILLIFDEIISGGRVALGGAEELYNIHPDITIIGKAISNGVMPISVMGGKKEIFNLFSSNKVTHLGTYNGYPMGITAIKTTLDILSQKNEPYKIMEEYAFKIKEIFFNAAKNQNIDIGFFGHPLSMSIGFEKISNGKYIISRRDNMKKTLLRNILLDLGIVLAPPTRIYLNTSFNDDDMYFIKERLPFVMKKFKNVF